MQHMVLVSAERNMPEASVREIIIFFLVKNIGIYDYVLNMRLKSLPQHPPN